MGYVLKTMTLDDGRVVSERGCANYMCRYCGGKAVACNYVANLCLQVAARHNGLCGAYQNNDKYVGYLTECATCAHYSDEKTCTFGD